MKKVFLVFATICALGFSNSYRATELDAPENKPFDTLRSIEQVLKVLDEAYVYPETAKKMRQHVSSAIALGHYRGISSSETLIEKLQADLRKASNDGHISLHLKADMLNPQDHRLPVTKQDTEVQAEVLAYTSGKKTIGYLRFNKFGNDQVKNDILNAMTQLGSTSSLIIDLRGNGGGDPNLVAFLSSYFVANDTPLWSIFDRDGNPIIEVKSNDDVSIENRYPGRICILTSGKTYSAAEAFAYTLKHLGRACIIGETSGGGAHLVEMQSVDDEISIRIPVARAHNPVTKSNWEGTGVVPDISVDASQAKLVALEHFQTKKN